MSSLGKKIDPVDRLPCMMPDAWPVFFHRRRPRLIQAAAMPAIVRGESVILSSPTASGKTEAAVAPLYQRHVSFGRKGLSVIYVAPTRALVNDLYGRLRDYLDARAESLVCRYTGDHHDFRTPQGAFVLLTTPEALDSLQLTQPGKLRNARAVVVDEVHLLHGTPRGEQLRYVLRRLWAAAEEPSHPKDRRQTVVMTATVRDPEGVQRYWTDGQGEIVTVGETRRIQALYAEIRGDTPSERALQGAEALRAWLEKNGESKVLVFGNSRNGAHRLAVSLHEKLAGGRWPVHFHVGILSAAERDRIEAAMRKSRYGVCVATSTLEVGIDIGDIDLIVLADVPHSVYSYLQRIGRGNRTSDTCRVLALHDGPEEKRLFDALHHCACRGLLDDEHEYQRPSVQFQQILSLAWRGMRSGDPLTLGNVEDRTGGLCFRDVLDDMLETGALREVRGALIPSDKLTDECDRRKMHTVLSEPMRTAIWDAGTGEVLAYGESDPEGELLFLGGGVRRISRSASGKMFAEKVEGRKRGVLASLPTARKGLDRGLSRSLVWALAEMEGRNPRRWALDEYGLVTWGGFRYNLLLAAVLKKAGAAPEMEPTAHGLAGLEAEAESFGPPRMAELVKQVEKAGGIPLSEARRFLQPSRYYDRLGEGLRRLEALNSVPFAACLRWLEECEEKVET